jgi:hypothetical protein
LANVLLLCLKQQKIARNNEMKNVLKQVMWSGLFTIALLSELNAQKKDSLEFIPDSLLLNDVTLTCMDGVDYSEIVLTDKNG